LLLSSLNEGMPSARRKVVLDDTDPRIQYAGDWISNANGTLDNNGNFGGTFQRTLHGLQGSSGSFELIFEGVVESLCVQNPPPSNYCFPIIIQVRELKYLEPCKTSGTIPPTQLGTASWMENASRSVQLSRSFEITGHSASIRMAPLGFTTCL
jgi:hypothetical protein